MAHETGLAPALRFSAYARQPDDRLALDEGALLLAEVAYPPRARGPALRQLDALADAVRGELGMLPGAMLAVETTGERATAECTLTALRVALAEHKGFRGDTERYYDPRNCFLSDVLERRKGMPITLSALYIEVARRLGAPLVGVGLPAHFVAKWSLPEEEGGDLFIDAFSRGVVMDYTTCRRFVLRLMSEQAGGPLVDASWFAPVATRAILTRMLRNLKTIYLRKGDSALALAATDRIVTLRPDLAEELRDRGLLRLSLGETLLAAADLAAYAERAPHAPEISRLRKRLREIRELSAKLN